MSNKLMLFLAGTCILALALITSPRQAAAQWADVDCGASKISMGPGITCRKGPSDKGSNSACDFQNYATFGNQKGVYFQAYLYISTVATQRCPVLPSTTARFEQSVKANSWVTNNGKEFTAPRTVGGMYLMNFAGGNRKCIAYHKLGPIVPGGYVYTSTGFFCSPANGNITDEQLTDLVSSLKIAS